MSVLHIDGTKLFRRDQLEMITNARTEFVWARGPARRSLAASDIRLI
jgi:hypothetical protein